MEAAQRLLEKLKAGSRVADLVRDMEMLSNAYVELANWPVDQFKKETSECSCFQVLFFFSGGSRKVFFVFIAECVCV